MLSETALSDAIGEQMKAWPPLWDSGEYEGMGGASCSWYSEVYTRTYVTIQAFPVEVLNADFIESDAANQCASDGSCIASGVYRDVWVGASVRTERVAEASEIRERLRSVVDEIGARATALPRPVPESRAGWWGPVPTCEDVSVALEATGITAADVAAPTDRPPLFANEPLARACVISATFDGTPYKTLVHLRSGAAGAVDSVIATTPEWRREVDGRVFAVAPEQYPIDGASGVLLGAVGPNLVELDRVDYSGETPQKDLDVIAAIVTALS